MIRGPPRCCGRGSVEAEMMEIKLVDKDVDYAHRIVRGDIVFEILGQQDSPLTVFAFNESLHVAARSERVTSVEAFSMRFHTSWTHRCPLTSCMECQSLSQLRPLIVADPYYLAG